MIPDVGQERNCFMIPDTRSGNCLNEHFYPRPFLVLASNSIVILFVLFFPFSLRRLQCETAWKSQLTQ